MNTKKKITSKEQCYRFSLLMALMVSAISFISAQSFDEDISAIADVIVDIGGSGDYTTVQTGINSIPDDNDTAKIIYVKKGIYYEKVILGYKKTKVILVGEDVDSTIISNDNYGNEMLIGGDPNNGGHTFSTYTFRADAHDFQAYNITFENPTTEGQGVAYHSNGDRQILYHCRLSGNQDTYFDNFRTRRYIKDCFIEGTTDYIFGFGVTLFDSCQIHSKSGNYITAASTPQYYEFGQVFKNCRLTAGPGISGISLGRPWYDWANTMFYECWMPASIKPEGWSAWSGGRENTCIYREYNCSGPGSDTNNRVEFAQQLDPSKASRYNIDTIFAASNFPSDMGYDVDTNEFMHMRRRQEASGYPARADTIIFAGREDLYASGDSFPPYPAENWSPEFHQEVFDLVNKYTVPFMDSVNGKFSVAGIHLNNNPIPDFKEETLEYVVELDDTITVMPAVAVIGENLSVGVKYPEQLPGEAIINISSRDKVIASDYKVYLSQDSAYWDADLYMVITNWKDTLEITPGIYSYDITLPAGDAKIIFMSVKTKVPGQKYTKELPEEYPGIATIVVTALDGVTINTYNLNILYPVGLTDTEANSIDIQVVNPSRSHLLILNEGEKILNAEISIFDLSGRTLFSKEISNLAHGINETGINISGLNKGIYMFSISANDKKHTGKFIKANQ